MIWKLRLEMLLEVCTSDFFYIHSKVMLHLEKANPFAKSQLYDFTFNGVQNIAVQEEQFYIVFAPIKCLMFL